MGKLPADKGDLFRSRLDSIINMNHELVQLSHELDWVWLEEQLGSYYADQGRPSIPVRKIAGLLLLKQLHKESDESVIDRWIENPYWQYFTGETYFQTSRPFDPTDFVLFRRRIGEQGMEKILSLTVKLHPGEEHSEIMQMDTTVQEKNISYPTDQKLALRVMEWMRRYAGWTGVKLRQTYEKEEKRLRRVATGQYRTKEGHARKRAYEFGCKVSVGRTSKKGVITAMKCFLGNPYDGDTIGATLEQVERVVNPLGGKRPACVVYDRGGRGR